MARQGEERLSGDFRPLACISRPRLDNKSRVNREIYARFCEGFGVQLPGPTRHRQGSLAYGGRRGAPAARQVADRFHLIQNLRQAVHTELVCQRVHLKIPAEEFTRQTETDQAPKTVQNISRPRRTWADPSQEEVRRQRWQHKVDLFQMVKSLRAQGAKVIGIMRQAGISRGLANKWLGLEECPPRAKRTSRPGMAEDFREELWRRWQQGQQEGKQLFAEIRQLGYVGSYASLMRFLEPWREAQGAVGKASRRSEANHPGAVRHVSPRVAVALLSKPKPQLNGKQSEMVEILKRRCPGFATMRHLVLSFRGILCNGKVSSLRKWMRKAEETGIGVIRAFVKQLKKDRAAVENAVEYVWSNGPVEGHINRLKTDTTLGGLNPPAPNRRKNRGICNCAKTAGCCST